ncbi:hypothetical protein ABEB36_000029 [Hypothenemus hampei]|uniref:Uncharacterized protein n=1 Tax=Hypothenemus hampei TaxID=57062 RepID=A0ABD1FA04_HYPHA
MHRHNRPPFIKISNPHVHQLDDCRSGIPSTRKPSDESLEESEQVQPDSRDIEIQNPTEHQEPDQINFDIFGSKAEENMELGPPINEEIASRWNLVLTNGLSEAQRDL